LDHTDLLIIGGGVSGLAAAYKAEEKNINYILLEKAPQLGGLTRSMNISDYIFDYTGHFLHLNYYKTPADINKNIHNDDWQIIQKKAKCFYDNTLINAPFQYNIGQFSDGLKEYLLKSYLEAQKDSTGKSNNFKQYFYEKYGKGIADAFLIPYNEKILATKLDRISLEAITRFFPAPNHRHIIAGASQEGNQYSAYNSEFWYPKFNGIQLLVDSFLKSIDFNRIQMSQKVTSINLSQKIIGLENGKHIKYNRLISSIPLKKFIYMCDELANYKPQLREDITAATVLSINIGVKTEIPERYKNIHWIYFSEKKYSFYRVGFYHNFNEVMAPKNCYSIYIEVGCSGFPHKNNNLLSKIIKELESIGIIDRKYIEVLTKNFMFDGYIHHTHNRSSIIETIFNFLKNHNVTCIGRYGKWQYSSMEDSIIEGYAAIEKMV